MQLISSFAVPRDRWLTGQLTASSLFSEGKADIVGHWLLASGIPEEELEDRKELVEVERKITFPSTKKAHEILGYIYEINDVAAGLSSHSREQVLILLFEQLGVEVTFFDHVG